MAGISCPSCGGKMVFDIPQQDLKCPFCGTRKEIDEYRQDNEAEVQKDTINTPVFICKNCGAELIAPDEQTVAYCAYCGSEAMLSDKYEDVIRPKKIIPFSKSKQQAKNAYEEALKGKLYVPKEFKDADFIEGFRGIYLPYYSYEAVIPQKTLDLKGKKNYTKSGYDYREEYNVHAELGGTTKGVKYDASIAFDDTIANEIAPFDAKYEKPYSDAYLAGFYADKATTDVSTYIEDATEDALNSVYKEISTKTGKVELKDQLSLEEKKAEIGIGSFNCDVVMYPIWFLTWRHKKRVAYSVMNGQSGKLSTDIPVDKKIFFLVSLIAAAVIFVLLSILPIFILPKTLSWIAAVILFISSIILEKEIKRIYEKEAHIYDYGDTTRKEKKKRMKPNEKKASSKLGGVGTGLGCLIIFIGYIAIYAIAGVIAAIELAVQGLSSPGAHTFFLIVAFLIQLVCSIFIVRYCLHLEKKSAFVPALFAPLALFFGLWVGLYNPAHDYWYYGSALACLVALILNGLSAINYFNYLTTRPVPNFFRREGADHEA